MHIYRERKKLYSCCTISSFPQWKVIYNDVNIGQEHLLIVLHFTCHNPEANSF